MSTTWRPYTEPPDPFKNVWLRFGDNGERDAIGFFSDGLGSYYKSVAAMHRRESVHPTHWRPICPEARKDA